MTLCFHLSPSLFHRLRVARFVLSPSSSLLSLVALSQPTRRSRSRVCTNEEGRGCFLAPLLARYRGDEASSFSFFFSFSTVETICGRLLFLSERGNVLNVDVDVEIYCMKVRSNLRVLRWNEIKEICLY